MRVALDTNILVYAEGINGSVKQQAALELLEKLPANAAAVPVQALGECFHVLVRKAGYRAVDARALILTWQDSYPTIETSAQVLLSATDLAMNHQCSLWDSVILSAAAAGGCRLLLSEDMQNGFTWSGVSVVNPFAASKHPLLIGLLKTL